MKPRIIGAAAACAVLLAGCGGSGGGGGSAASAKPSANGEAAKTGPQVAEDAATALEASGAVHVKGTSATGGQAGGLDFQLQGSDGSGTLSVGGQSLSLVLLAGKTYAMGSTAFWRSSGVPAQGAALLNNRWVVVPAAQASAFTSELSLSKIADGLRHPTKGTFQQQVGSGQYNGQPTVVLTDTNGSVTDVAATGQPYPLHVVNKSATGDDIALSGFGVRQDIVAPPDPLDLSTLGR